MIQATMTHVKKYRSCFTAPRRALMAITFSCLLGLCMFCLYFMLVNAHVSKLYVKYQSLLYPANITIRPKCVWDGKEPFDFKDYRPYQHVAIAKMLHVAYKQFGMIPVLKHGSFLHTFRRTKADDDMDIYLIVPKEFTLSMAYEKLQNITRSFREFRNISFGVLNPYLSAFVYNKCDSARILFNGKVITDLVMLHETLLNDPALQAPCLLIDSTLCKPFSAIGVPYIQYHKRELSTANMFENLCECQYMDAILVCFNDNGALYLETSYGRSYKQKRDDPKQYKISYDRRHRYLEKLVTKFPQLINIRYIFRLIYFGLTDFPFNS